MTSRDYHVIIATDCRLPGGTAASSAEEINAQSALGLRSGIVHIDSPLVGRTRPLNPRLRACITGGEADLLLRGRRVTTDLLVIRHPRVALSTDPGSLPSVDALHCVVLANQVPVTGAGVQYTAREVDSAVERWLGIPPLWAPIGPLVREALVAAEPGLQLMDGDWVNIIDVDGWAVPRLPPSGARLRIGRHSRDHRLKWPADREELLLAYPDSDEVEVRILGGVPQVEALLGDRRPSNWTLFPFGTVHPRDFLRDVDVYVYFHHPSLTEAFGRNVLEAMASGAPVITHPHFRPLFADSVLYSEPSGVMDALRELSVDPDLYLRYSIRGQEFARRHFGYEEHWRRIGSFVTELPSVEPVSRVEVGAVAARPSTVLFISPNGAGMGHLTRVMAAARRLPEGVTARFLTFSTAANVVERAGFDVDYFPSRSVTNARSAAWHTALAERLEEMIGELRPAAVVIDGTEPYRGILQALTGHPEIPVVWSRRGMWKAGVSNPVLREGQAFFDLIIEPGELAASSDRGATSHVQAQVHRVAPVTYLGIDELLPRQQAREELGLPADDLAVLVQLGAGNINDTLTTTSWALDGLRSHGPCRIFVTQSQITSNTRDPGDGGVTVLDIYPLSKYLYAFDLAIAAAGYNSFHELLMAGVPTAFVPNDATITDDQRGRAQWAHDHGFALCAASDDEVSVRSVVESIIDPEQRTALRAKLETLTWTNGASEMSGLIEGVIESSPHDVARRADERGVVFGSLGLGDSARGGTREHVHGRGAGELSVRSTSVALLRRSLAATRRRVGDDRLLPIAHRLPRRVQARLRRLAAIPNRRAGRGDAESLLPVPAGSLLATADPSVLVPVLLILDPSVSNNDAAEAVARLQALERTFAPVFLTTSLDSAGFKRYGYLWEHVRLGSLAEEHDVATNPDLGSSDRRRARIRQLVRWYRPAIVVEVSDLDHDLSVETSLLATLIRALDPTMSTP
jgi:UDP:flavonoid glycosyltransferase YjiC (YdhE family)